MGKIGIAAATVMTLWLCGAAAAESGGQLAQMGPGMGGGMGRGMGGGMMQHGANHPGNPVRHSVVRRGGVPAPYADMKNPLAGNAQDIDAGRKLYVEQCSTCHGMKGAGDGIAGSTLEPKPANLAFIIDKWVATDGFLMWSMSEGGEPLGTAMPAYKDILSEPQRWQIVHFLRAGLGQ